MQAKGYPKYDGPALVRLEEARRALAAAVLWWNQVLAAERASEVNRDCPSHYRKRTDRYAAWSISAEEARVG
jgi:hypothetical protein